MVVEVVVVVLVVVAVVDVVVVVELPVVVVVEVVVVAEAVSATLAHPYILKAILIISPKKKPATKTFFI